MPVAELFLAAFINVLFQKLSSPEFWKSIRVEGITSQLKKSMNLLSLLRAVLVDAGQKQITDEAVRDWVNDLQALTYDLDDIVDDLLYEATRRELRAESRSSTSSSSCSSSSLNMVTSLIPTCFTPLVFNHRMKTKLDEITERLKDLIEQKNVLGLRDNVPSSSNKRLPEAPILVDEWSIQGRDSDKMELLSLVLDEKPCDDHGSVGIIPIVGMGGVGKTTLAQLIYNDDRVKACFPVRVWVCVSEDFDVFGITKIIFQEVTGERSNFEALTQLQTALKEKISKMKFLLVLDDVWNQNREKWERLRCSFQVGLPGSKIIVTTRNDGVVSTMRCGPSYRLKELTEEASISLLAQNSLGDQNFEAHPDFRLIGERIVRKCAGLPLALKTLGSLLGTKASVEEWEELHNSDIWNLSEDDSSILPALRLSYHHLSPDLKQLFAYCSLFPKDYLFDMDELVLLWMGEGFLHKSDSHQRMEDLGQKYFKELLSRSFFQNSSDQDSKYVMHDLMNDLAKFVAGEFFFRSDDEKKTRMEHRINDRTHYASFVRHEHEAFSNFKDFHRAKGLRTFLPLPVQKLDRWRPCFISNNIVVGLVPKLQCLRVLSLNGYFIRELPYTMSRMKHLRYLNLSQTAIKCLPEWVSHLYNLQVLLLFGCEYLDKLPTTFMHLTGLRHFNIADTSNLKELPLGIGKLTSLQTLSKIFLSEGSGVRLRELKDLSDLRGVLSIIGLQNVMNVHDAKAANLISKQCLDDLEMMWSDNFDGSRDEVLEKEILDALKPYSNLKRVDIRFYGGLEFPSWVGNPSFCHIEEVKLRGCRKCTLLPSLGQLPLLKKLFIESAEGVKVVGSEFYINAADNGRMPVAFPLLELLQFSDMENCEEWSSENVIDVVSMFPRLEELEISHSPKLVEVSLRKVLSLQRLKMRGCGEAALRSMLGVAIHITTLEIENISGLTGLHDEGVFEYHDIVSLKITDCEELKYLWSRGSEAAAAATLQGYAKLKRLSVFGCNQLVSLVEREGVLPHNLEELELEYCTNLEKLPHNWCNHLKCLKSLIITGCPKLQDSSGTETMTQQGLNERRNGGGGILIKQSSSSRNEMKEEEEEMGFCRLERMEVGGCSSLTWLPTGGQKKKLPTTLKHLRIYDCLQLEEPEEKNWLLNSKSSLESIWIDNWGNLKSLTSSTATGELGTIRGGIGFQNFIHLTSLLIFDCPGLESIPERGGGGLPPCLKELNIKGCENLKWLLPNASNYGGWDQCHSLTLMQVIDCPRLEGFPCGVWPPHLEYLDLGGVLGKPTHITQGNWGLHNAPPTLKVLWLHGKFPELVSFSINRGITGDQSSLSLLPPSLTHLYLYGREELETLSSGLQNLTSLRHLHIYNCPKLRSLPETLLPSLSQLRIFGNCPILKKRCSKKEKGDYWPLLSSHIPHVGFDDGDD